MEVASLCRLLRIVASGEKTDRLSLSRLDGASREYFSDALEAVARRADHAADTIRAHVTISTLLRRLWTLVPPTLLESRAPNFRALAHEALTSRYAATEITADDVGYLGVIFKRIRVGLRYGRRASSLNLELQAHRRLLDQQKNRCNHCLYEFGLDLYRYSVEEDDIPAEPYTAAPGELAPATVFRKPELDHIIPVLLGGDSEKNWQILCRSCNAGKSDLLSYFFNYTSRRYGRAADLLEVTAGKRYAVIADARGAETAIAAPGDGRFYRLFKRKEAGFCNAENLVARYC